MAKIITLSHQKGGVGKSSLVLNLAYSFKEHLKTAIVDLDVQGTISQLRPLIKGINVISGVSTLESLKELPYDVIFVDTPPYLSSDLPQLFKISDLVLIPTKAGVADLMAIRATINLLQEASKDNASIKKAIVFNMIKSSSNITGEIKQIVEEYTVPVLKQMVTDRVSFARSLAIENGIYGTEDLKAQEEIDGLTEEIIDILNN